MGSAIRDRVQAVLEGVDLSVAKGEFLTILGPSGCGKSTLLRAIADLLPPINGRLSVPGKSAAEARRQREVGFVFQEATLLPGARCETMFACHCRLEKAA